MVSVTLSIPPETKELMNKFSEINWSGFIRKSIEEKAKQLSWREKMLKRLKAEEPYDLIALEIGDKIKQAAWSKHRGK